MGTQPYIAAWWSNQTQPRKNARDCAECALSANRGSIRNATSALQATASNRVIKLINWNQCRVADVLQRVHTDCFGKKFRPQRSQNNLALPRCWNGDHSPTQTTASRPPKTTGLKFSVTKGQYRSRYQPRPQSPGGSQACHRNKTCVYNMLQYFWRVLSVDRAFAP